MKQRLGILGGTFDPPHYGHMVLAEAGRDQLELDRVLFVPAGQPPHKPQRPVTPGLHRLAMLGLVIAGREGLDTSRADLDRPGPHYTADLLSILRRAYPEAHLYFLMGGDSLAQFPTWYRPERIVEHAMLAVLRRPGWEADLELLEEQIPDVRDRIVWLDGPFVEVSGSEIRERVRKGRLITGLVQPEVEDYIYRHRLYQHSAVA
jgi:nicotinate-nucleotide adenylyltransferase